ncbi:hypothetical protein FB2170_01352 [Maribacter sp. HTCC2170]|nr:hypothetical protein FB2170_01352 [Maribacter sp. HTCC2170]
MLTIVGVFLRFFREARGFSLSKSVFFDFSFNGTKKADSFLSRLFFEV